MSGRRAEQDDDEREPGNTAIAWDPSCPSKVVVIDYKRNSEDVMEFGSLASDQSGCNRHELVALIRIVQAQSDFYNGGNSRALANSCRLALQQCLQEWEQDETMNQDGDNLELLKLTLAVLHLSDIILPLLHGQRQQQQYNKRSFYFPTNSHAFPNVPGIVTVPFIRFLRYHYNSPALVHPDIPFMLEAQQPELYQLNAMHESESLSLYWRYVETCVLRGCLTQAYQALQRHSLYQNALAILDSEEEDTFLVEQAQEIVRGFHNLKLILGLAPLPGGRTDADDDLVDQSDEDAQRAMDDDEQAMDGDDSNWALPGLDVTVNDYKYWEFQAGQDYPVVYEADIAARKHRDWQRYIQERIRPRFSLFHRIPQLHRLLDILAGFLDDVYFSSWAEHLCASLLYQCPTLLPHQIPTLAKKYMRQAEADNGDDDQGLSSENEILLNIMEGKPAETIAALYNLGGATGAALPTTLMAVICSLYVEANILPSDSVSLQKEFLCEAAMAIVSSLADKGSADTATGLALQLLIPHLEENNNNNDISMCIVHILERYFPRSDAEARKIISLISLAIRVQQDNSTPKQQNSYNCYLPIIEAAEAVFLCRYRHYVKQGLLGVSIPWLADGIQFRILTGASAESSCYRTLCALCNSYTTNLLQMMVGGKQDEARATMFHETETIVMAIRENNSFAPNAHGAFALAHVKEVQVLLQVERLTETFLIAKDYVSAARLVIACMEEVKNKTTGSVERLLPLSLHWPLLMIAKAILVDEEKQQLANTLGTFLVVSSFNQKDVSCLMESLLQVLKLSTSANTTWGMSLDDNKVLLELQKLLARALARACVVENAKKKRQPHARTIDETIASIRSVDLDQYQPNVQQAVVLNMLEL